MTKPTSQIAGRAKNGDIRMDEGRGALVAIQSDSRYQIEERLIESRPGRYRDQAAAALALLDREADAARVAAGIPRPNTADRKTLHGVTFTRKRLCNACGRVLGDMTKPELTAWADKQPLADVHDECGCVQAARHPATRCTCGPGFHCTAQHLTDEAQARLRAENLYANAEAAYRAAHPEFVPSDLQRGERVTMAGTGSGTIVDSREQGASLTVQWDNLGGAILQNIASGHLTRLTQNAGR